jgi:hypothetical protein
MLKRPGFLIKIPTILDIAVSIFMEYVQSGVRLYGDSPWTWTHCQEKLHTNWPLVVGGFSPGGLYVYIFNIFDADDPHEACGMGALRKF